jgi:hypothetical protein
MVSQLIYLEDEIKREKWMMDRGTKIEEIILHVGLHKTGTTSIQQTLFLDENKKLLEEQDYMYIKSWSENHSIPIYSVFCDYPESYHINIGYGYRIEEIREINQNYLRLFEREITERQQTKLILSGEDISVLSLTNLIALKEYLVSIFTKQIKIKVIIYVRDPQSWSVSAIQEIIKNEGTYQITLEKINDELKNFFRNRLEKFERVFGKESVYIYSFEEAIKHEFGPVGHFLSMVGFKHEQISKFNIIRSNERVSLVTGEILSYINEKIPMIINGKLNEKRSNGDFVPLLNIAGPKFDIPDNDKKKLFESCREDVEWLKDNFEIDYSDIEVAETDQLIYEFDEKIIEGIKESFFNISLPLKEVMIEFLQEKLQNNVNHQNNVLLRELLDEFITSHREQTRVEQLIKNLGIKENIDPAEIYQEVALFMEYHNQISSAKVLMEKAFEYKPNNRFIQEKCNEYNELLKKVKKKKWLSLEKLSKFWKL